MRRWWIVATMSWAVACGNEPVGSSDPVIAAPPAEAPADVEVPAGDPLLTRARQGISEGRLDPAVEAELTGSTAPTHARARRILLAMAQPPVVGDAEPEPSADDASLRPPPIVPQSDAVPSVAAGAPSSAKSGTGTRPKSTPTPTPTPRAAAEVRRLSMKSTTRGATLTIAAPSSLVVGVANQPSSGIVRLVIEKAKAGSSVLTTRPKMVGAAVTAVRQGKDTVQITLRLDPGWRLGSVKPFSGGAKVHLLAPR